MEALKKPAPGKEAGKKNEPGSSDRQIIDTDFSYKSRIISFLSDAVRGQHGEIRLNCPECEGGQEKTLGVNADTGFYQCFRCEIKGNLNNGHKKEKLPYPEYLWDKCTFTFNHPYLTLKQVPSYGLKQDHTGNLVVPLSQYGQLSTLQYITTEEKKLLKKEKGGIKKGSSFTIPGDIGSPKKVYVCEGYATTATVRKVTGCETIMAVDAGNLVPVVENLKRKYQDYEWIFCADNDANSKGLIEALKAAALVQGKVTMPEKIGQDFNDLFVELGLDAVMEQLEKFIDPGQAKPEQTQVSKLWNSPVNLMDLLHIDPDPVKWFINNRIVAGRGVLVSGVGGSSKTRLLYHLAAGAALGELPWEWDISNTGRTVLVLTEDTADDLHRTLHNLTMSLNLSLEDKQKVYQSIIPYPLAGKDVRLLTKSKTNTLIKSDAFRALSQKIRDLGDVAFIGLDPALGLTDGEELDQGNQRLLGKMADDLAVQTGAACALVTHAAKGSLHLEELSSHNSRGGGAITDAVRAEFVMRTMTSKESARAKIKDKEERFRHVQLVATKGNILPPAAYTPVWLRRDAFGMLHGSDIVLNDSQGPTQNDMRALGILKTMSLTGHVTIGEWRDACRAEGILNGDNDNTISQQMQRARKRLQEEDLIKPGPGKGVWMPCDLEKEAVDYDLRFKSKVHQTNSDS